MDFFTLPHLHLFWLQLHISRENMTVVLSCLLETHIHLFVLTFVGFTQSTQF